MNHYEVVKYLTQHLTSRYYKANVAALMQSLGHAQAHQYLLSLILINDKEKSNLLEVPE